MHPTSIHHRRPRAGVDPIVDASSALEVVALALHQPPRDETIVIALDDASCGTAILVVADTVEPDAVLDVVELVAAGAGGDRRAGGIVVASMRVSRRSRLFDASRDDADRWLEMSALTDDAGLQLIEWFVLDEQIRCPRDLLGVPPRW